MARARFVLLVPLALLVPAACSDDDDPPARSGSASGSEAEGTTTTTEGTTSTTADDGEPGAPTSTTTPDAEGIPLAGDGGEGSFAYDLVVARSELCYGLDADPAPTAARILRVDGGGLVLDLRGAGNHCVASDAITLEEIGTTPADFAVEVTTADGTLRATLR